MRRKYPQLVSAIMATLLFSSTIVARPGVVLADTADVPSLTISQLKITSSNGQFITLYNATATALDMSHFQLEYFNNYDLSKATSSRLIALSGIVPPHGYFMVNDSALLLCYQLTINSVSLGLSSTAGMVQVLGSNQASPGGPVTPVLQDYVGWSKTAAAGAQTLPANTSAFLQRQPVNAQNNPVVGSPGSGSWQTVLPDASNACALTTANGANVPTGLSQLLPSTEPPATIIDGAISDSAPLTISANLPAADIGLMAPQITELLPNPTGTGNDATDEYIELYNPNDVSFDLSGFGLQTGLTSLRTYNIPAGTSLPPKSFTAFYSETTALSLSNTSSQAKLLDPSGNSISASDIYGTAKDGQAWALANGKWYWTTELTPNAANVIKQPVTAKKLTATTKSKSTTTKAKTTKTVTAKKPTTTSAAYTEEPVTTPIHTQALALVGGGALLYGAYEYRTDLANKIFRLRRYLGAGRTDRN